MKVCRIFLALTVLFCLCAESSTATPEFSKTQKKEIQAFCVINQIKSMTEGGDTMNTIVKLPGVSEQILEEVGDQVCTKHKNGKVKIGNYCLNCVTAPTWTSESEFHSNRQDEYHPYIEVYCRYNLYYEYDGNKWQSTRQAWNKSDQPLKCQ